MNLKFLGIGGATNIELGGNCAFINKEDKLLLIDVCEGATEKLNKLKMFNGIKEIYVVITHTHFDHIAGLGVLIWYCNFILNIKPKVIYGDLKYKSHLIELLKITGVNEKLVEFVKDEEILISDIKLQLLKTIHTPSLMCYGIMFQDALGKYYYTGDTNDVEYVKKLSEDINIKRIYSEVATETFDVHIKYDDIIDLDKSKLVLMHFNTMELYDRVKKDGFKVAELIK